MSFVAFEFYDGHSNYDFVLLQVAYMLDSIKSILLLARSSPTPRPKCAQSSPRMRLGRMIPAALPDGSIGTLTLLLIQACGWAGGGDSSELQRRASHDWYTNCASRGTSRALTLEMRGQSIQIRATQNPRDGLQTPDKVCAVCCIAVHTRV